MTQERDDIVALDSTIILHPRVWRHPGTSRASPDPLVDCRSCKKRFRAGPTSSTASAGKKPSKHPVRPRTAT